MLLGLFLYIAWAVELSGVTRTTAGMFWPNWLHLALVFVLWRRSGVSAVLWGATIGLLLDLQSGMAGIHLLLVSTLSLVAADWREGNDCRSGPALALMGTVVLAFILLAAQLWRGLPAGQLPPAPQLAACVMGPATSAVLAALVLRWSLQLSRHFVGVAVSSGSLYET